MSFEDERYVSNRIDKIEALEEEIAKLKEENSKLKKVLGFYGSFQNWNSSYEEPIFYGESIGGEAARKVLGIKK